MRLHIVSWNLHGVPLAAPRRTERMKLAAKRLQALRPEPDVILLQEVFFPSDLKLLKKRIGGHYRLVDDMPQRAYPPWFLPLVNLGGIVMRFRKSGLVAFVHRRWDVVDSHFEEFRAEELEIKFWEGDGYADKGFHRLDLRHTKNGARVTVFNTHTQSRRRHHEIRKAQISQLAAAAYAVDREIPVVLAGDFNVRPTERTYRLMTEDFRWQDLTRGLAKCGDRMGFAEGSRERISRRRDYVFALTNTRWQFVGRAEFICNLAVDVPYSDHHGLDTHIEIRPRLESSDQAEPLSRLGTVPLAVLAARTLHGPSTRRAWLLALLALAFSRPSESPPMNADERE